MWPSEIGSSPTLRGKARMLGMRLLMGGVPDVVSTLEVRPALFGRPFHAGLQRLLRESEHWQPAEAELLAAEVSQANTCPFCVGIHTQVTAGLLGAHYPNPDEVAADPRLQAAVEFARKVTREPEAVTEHDVEALREQGLDDEAIEEIAYIAGFFSTINRTANALQFDELEGRSLWWASFMLRNLGYYDV